MTDTGMLEIECRSCGAALSLQPHLRTAECPYCASPTVVERPATSDRPDPAFVLGFVVDRERAMTAVRDWIHSRGPFAHSGFKKATLERTRGVYLPAYLFSSEADTSYEAEIGEDYTVTEYRKDSDGGGFRRVTKTEYRDLAGRQGRYVHDVLVTASRGIPNQELEMIEPFDLRALKRYTPAVLSGWIAEEPSLSRDECLRLARDESVERVGAELADFMPGDSHRSLRYRTRLLDHAIDLILLPVWVFAARYAENKPPVRILLNGQTGKIHGRVPLSAVKISAAIALGLGLVALLLWILNVI